MKSFNINIARLYGLLIFSSIYTLSQGASARVEISVPDYSLEIRPEEASNPSGSKKPTEDIELQDVNNKQVNDDKGNSCISSISCREFCCGGSGCLDASCRPDPYCPSCTHLFKCCLCSECCKVDIAYFDDEIGYNRQGYAVAVGKDKDNIVAQLCCDYPGRKCIDNTCRACCWIPFGAIVGSCFVMCLPLQFFGSISGINMGCSFCCPLCESVDKMLVDSNLDFCRCCKCYVTSCSEDDDFIAIPCCACWYQGVGQYVPMCLLGSCVQCLGGVCCAEEYLFKRSYSELQRVGVNDMNALTTTSDGRVCICCIARNSTFYTLPVTERLNVMYPVKHSIYPPRVVEMNN